MIFLPLMAKAATAVTAKVLLKKAAVQLLCTASAKAAENLAESFYKNVVCDQIQPVRGSILKVDLIGKAVSTKSLCHTGVYIGNNQIIEMSNDGGKGVINKVSPYEFLNYSSCRFGVYIYVACGKKDGIYYPLGCEDIAERAEQSIGETVDYNLVLDNCHLFTGRCITGNIKSRIGLLESVEKPLRQKYNLSKGVYWMSTGVSSDGHFEE